MSSFWSWASANAVPFGFSHQDKTGYPITCINWQFIKPIDDLTRLNLFSCD